MSVLVYRLVRDLAIDSLEQLQERHRRAQASLLTKPKAPHVALHFLLMETQVVILVVHL